MCVKSGDLSGSKGGCKGSVCSDVHTKETFEQFWKPTEDKNSAKSSFLVAHNRCKNLDIAKALDGCKFSDNEHIKKIVKGLKCCSSMALIEEQNGEARIFRTSDKCRRPLCPICNRIRSTKFVSRFVSAYNSPVGKPLFLNKYFYKIEFTLKHDRKSIRNKVYLGELKAYLKQMQRSKLWKKHFPYTKKDPQSGWANCFEVTITSNGFHIHVHILMCSPRLVGKVTDIQNDFRDRWYKITKDSNGCNIDLIKMDLESKKAIDQGENSCAFLSEIMEVFKYTVKVGDISKLSEHADDLAEYVIETKGKNMVTAKGFFRGLQLFGCKSIWDETEGESATDEIDENNSYYVGRTVDVEFNKKTHKYIDKRQRKKVLDSVFIRGIMVDEPENIKKKVHEVIRTKDYSKLPRCFIDISDCVNIFMKYFDMKVFDTDFKTLPDWILYCRERMYTEDQREIESVVSDVVVCEDIKNEQLALFGGSESDNVIASNLEFW